MKFDLLLSYFALLFLLGCNDQIKNKVISLTSLPPTILDENNNEIFQYWEVTNDEYLFDYTLGDVKALKAYKDSVRKIIGDSLLNKKIKEERVQSKANKKDVQSDSLNNYDLIHNGYIGHIRRINFIEAEILNYQISRFPLFSHPTEFHAFITRNDSLGIIRIYFGASDQPWPPKPKPIITHLEGSLGKGWFLISHLHNHYEPASNNYVGVMAPSLADAHYFKILKNRFNLSEALITNGFSTVVLKNKEFKRLNSH